MGGAGARDEHDGGSRDRLGLVVAVSRPLSGPTDPLHVAAMRAPRGVPRSDVPEQQTSG